MSIELLEHPEEPKRVEQNFFLLKTIFKIYFDLNCISCTNILLYAHKDFFLIWYSKMQLRKIHKMYIFHYFFPLNYLTLYRIWLIDVSLGWLCNWNGNLTFQRIIFKFLNGLPYVFLAKNKVKPKVNLNIFGFGLRWPIYILVLFLNVWEHYGSSVLFLDRMFLCVLYSWKPLNVSTWEVLINLQKCHICIDVILHVTNVKNTK